MARKVKRRPNRLVLRTERCDLMRAMLIAALGGKCWACGCTDNLEPDHVEGCTWRHNRQNREGRLRRYADEFRRGVPMRAACRSHNASRNQAVYGTRAEREQHRPLADVIEEIEAADREAA